MNRFKNTILIILICLFAYKITIYFIKKTPMRFSEESLQTLGFKKGLYEKKDR